MHPEAIIYMKEKITTWNKIEINKDVILYYKKIEPLNDKLGFDFYCIEYNAWDMDGTPDSCECLLNGTAYYDGIRHFYLGDKQTENEGYLYYPNLKSIIKCLEEIRKLGKKFCRMYQD